MSKIPVAIFKDVDTKHLNTFGIANKTQYFSTIHTPQELSALLEHDELKDVPKMFLGGGSNIVFTQNYAGWLIKNAISGIKHLEEDSEHYYIEVGAGENWHDFVMYCIAHGYPGLENLSLIPGTVGAAPIQNIGAYGVELSSTLYAVKAMHLQDGKIVTFANKDCEFAYRDSIFKRKYKNKYIILSVVFKLNKTPQFHLDYGAIKETLIKMNVNEINIKTISDAVIFIRRAKLPDPKTLGNAGSFFKNPFVPTDTFAALQKKYPTMPHHVSKDKPSLVKINAAWLIEQCGFKGKRFGNIGVYEKQALILVNYGNGNGQEILALARKIQASVVKEFGIHLELEVNLI